MWERPGLREQASVSLNARGCAPARRAWSRIYNPVPPAPALVARRVRAGAAAAGQQGCFLLRLLEPHLPREQVEGEQQPQQEEGVRCKQALLPTFKSWSATYPRGQDMLLSPLPSLAATGARRGGIADPTPANSP